MTGLQRCKSRTRQHHRSVKLRLALYQGRLSTESWARVRYEKARSILQSRSTMIHRCGGWCSVAENVLRSICLGYIPVLTVPAPSKDIQRSGFHHPTESGSCAPLAQRRLLLECDILASRHGEFVEKSIFMLSVHAVVGGYWMAGLRAS